MKTAILIPLLLSLSWAQYDECPVITESELGRLDALSTSGLVAERLGSSQSDIPNVRIFDYNIVCFAAGSARETYRVLSVVVQYQCSGTFCDVSPLGRQGNGTSQFEFTCSGGSWTNEVEGSGDASSTFTNPSNATVGTQARRDCSFCLRPDVAASGVFSPALILDNITHCAEVNITTPFFNGTSYVAYEPLSSAAFSINFTVVFNSSSSTGIIFFVSITEMDYGDYLALVLLDGTLQFRYNLGSGTTVISSPGTIELNVCHTVVICRSGSAGSLAVDDMNPVFGTSPGPNTQLNVFSNLYLGGLPSNINVASVVGTPDGFVGCIPTLSIDGIQRDPFLDADFGYGIGECGFTFCSPNPCLNGATCIEMLYSYMCECTAGFLGHRCSSLRDPCEENASICTTGATCIPGSDGINYTCLCPPGRGESGCEIGVQCPALGDPLNGTVTTTADRFDGSTANYSCDNGFNLQGPASRICQDDATWSSAAPTCVTGGLSSGDTIDSFILIVLTVLAGTVIVSGTVIAALMVLVFFRRRRLKKSTLCKASFNALSSPSYSMTVRGREPDSPPQPDATPTLPLLISFPTETTPLNIPRQIGTGYAMLGPLLLQDDSGVRVASLRAQYMLDTDEINLAILREWLEGRGLRPVTWDTLTTAMAEARLVSLAEQINEVIYVALTV